MLMSTDIQSMRSQFRSRL